MSESQLLSSIIEYLELFGGRVYRIYNGGVPAGVRNGKLAFRRKNEKHKGVSDLICFLRGRTFFIETKTNNGQITKEQSVFLDTAAKNGSYSMVVRSLEELKECLKKVLYEGLC